MIFSDDVSARELPVYGASVWSKPKGGDTSDAQFLAKTPVLDRLASEGCWITTTWSATVCMPSRAMMMTGRYANRTKWWHNRDKGLVQAPGGRRSWQLFESSPITLGQVATMGGYGSVWAGKTQMGCNETEFQRFGFSEGVLISGGELQNIPLPENSFTTSVIKDDGQRFVLNMDSGKTAPGFPLARRSYGYKPFVALMNERGVKAGMEWWPNTPESRASFGLNTFGPDVEVDYCLDFMERQHRAGRPFFVYHPTNLGHGTFDWLDPESDSKWPGTPKIEWDGQRYHRTEPNITGADGVYDTHGTVTGPGMHSHINYMDYMMWRYMEKVRELGELDNTVFIFTSDNGSHLFGKGQLTQQRGTHVPLIIYAPGMTKRGEQNILVSLTDFLPTLADIMGVELPGTYPIDGESLWPYLTTGKTEHRDWVYATGRKGLPIIRGRRLIRDGYGKWWDAATLPPDHMSFPEIKDWERTPAALREEKRQLEGHLYRLHTYDTDHDAPDQ